MSLEQMHKVNQQFNMLKQIVVPSRLDLLYDLLCTLVVMEAK